MAAPISQEKIDVLTEFCVDVNIIPNLTSELFDEASLELEIIEYANKINADAIVTLDEFSVVAVSMAAEKLNLRGAGVNVKRSRNKFLMRESFSEAGVPNPKYLKLTAATDTSNLLKTLNTPFIIKVTEGAGSYCHTLINRKSDFEIEFQLLLDKVSTVGYDKSLGVVDSFRKPEFIAEEIIDATTDSWYEEPGYGNYVSVEGFVINGVYYPVSITSRLPTIPPFTETGLQTPCELSPFKRKLIENMARKAVDAMKLSCCGTHTEIKLLKDNKMCLIETAARLPGASITMMVEDAFGVDLIGSLVELLLYGKSDSIPSTMIDSNYIQSTGSVALVPTDASGRPWKTKPKLNKNIDISKIIPKGVKYEVIWNKGLFDGQEVQSYDLKKGYFNFLGGVYLKAEKTHDIMLAQLSILNNLEDLLNNSKDN
ncbi:L-amino acid ligase [Yersinia intermedia ATCC 29909]|nr:L-amino acid ligase [Yersinia intermedia ATCC 29909]